MSAAVGRILGKLMGERTLQYHSTQIRHEVTSLGKLASFAVPVGMVVLWCAFPAIPDETKSMVGIPVAEKPETVGATKYKLEEIDAMPVLK